MSANNVLTDPARCGHNVYMTTSERITHLNTGDRVAITINNDRNERLVGRVVALLPHAVRLNTGERTVSISRDSGFISRVARVA